MYNSGKVIIGIIVFVIFFGLPFWLNLGKVEAVPQPKLPTEEKKCIEDKYYMRANHMKLLDRWRKQKVREGKVYYTNSEGKIYKMSLQRTCMKCHSNKEKFCDTCHKNMAVVSVDCWKCHLAPEEVQKWQ